MAKRKARKRRSTSTSKKVQVRTSNGGQAGHSCCDSRGLAWIFVILGVLYLFTDLGWITWWDINWWTIIFLIFGIKMLKK